MVPVPFSRQQSSGADAIENWPLLNEAVLRAGRSRQVCMTCHVFRHHQALVSLAVRDNWSGNHEPLTPRLR